MGRQIEVLAQFIATTQWEDIPEAVQSHTKLVLLDTLGVILAGAERAEVRDLRSRLSQAGGTGATVYARGWPSQDPRTAAFLNGIAGRSRRSPGLKPSQTRSKSRWASSSAVASLPTACSTISASAGPSRATIFAFMPAAIPCIPLLIRSMRLWST